MSENETSEKVYEWIEVLDCAGCIAKFANPSNIIEHTENGGWLEFDTTTYVSKHILKLTTKTRHKRLHMATIVGYTEIVSSVET